MRVKPRRASDRGDGLPTARLVIGLCVIVWTLVPGRWSFLLHCVTDERAQVHVVISSLDCEDYFHTDQQHRVLCPGFGADRPAILLLAFIRDSGLAQALRLTGHEHFVQNTLPDPRRGALTIADFAS